MKNFDIVTIGGAARDIIFRTDAGEVIDNDKDLTRAKLVCFESGAKIVTKEASFTLGGGACNAAVCWARLGFSAGIIAKTGKDREAEKILEDLALEKVDGSFIDQDRKSITGLSFFIIALDSNEHTAFLFRGANDTLQVTDPILSKIKTKWIYLTSLSGNDWHLVLRNVSKFAHNSKYPPGTFKKTRGVRWIWNPGQAQIEAGKRAIEQFLSLADVLILNKDEAIELVISDKKNVGSKAQLKNEEFLLRTIQSWGASIVVITCGENGAYAVEGDNIYYEKAEKVKAVDTTGAGDAFGATFAAGLEFYNGDIRKALKLGMANSASVVTRVGAQAGLLTREELGI